MASPSQKLPDIFPRRTKTRGEIFKVIARKSYPFTAEEICATLPTIGRATVYRTLSRLTKSGYLCKVLLDGDVLHYQLAPDTHHHHLVCVDCNRVVDVESCEITEFVRKAVARQSDYQLLGHRLEIYGRCSACQRTRRGNN